MAARALSKHAHRATDGFWPQATGKISDINERAEQMIFTILNNAAWMNIHMLPQDVSVFEVRTVEGYGVRWTANGRSFRGFLEPQMEDGHEKRMCYAY